MMYGKSLQCFIEKAVKHLQHRLYTALRFLTNTTRCDFFLINSKTEKREKFIAAILYLLRT